MDVLTSLAIVLLTAMAHASLQLTSGSLILLYHSALGKYPRKKARALGGVFMGGVSLMIFLSLSTVSFLILTLKTGKLNTLELSFLVGMLAMIGILIMLFYYRKGKSTALWLPKNITRFINLRARKLNHKLEAFSLGFLAYFAELPIGIILLVIAANNILSLPNLIQILAIFSYVGIVSLPLLIVRWIFKKDHNMVEVQKWRVKNKSFIKAISGMSFLTLALFISAFKLGF